MPTQHTHNADFIQDFLKITDYAEERIDDNKEEIVQLRARLHRLEEEHRKLRAQNLPLLAIHTVWLTLWVWQLWGAGWTS